MFKTCHSSHVSSQPGTESTQIDRQNQGMQDLRAQLLQAEVDRKACDEIHNRFMYCSFCLIGTKQP